MTNLIRRAGAHVLKLLERTLDPGAVADLVQVYSKDVGGISQLFAQTEDSAVYQLTIDVTGIGSRWYGTGIDGALVFDGVSTVTGSGFFGLSIVPAAGIYTLTRDTFASSMTVDAGVEVVTGGYRLFVLGALVLNGKITSNGGAGSDGGVTAGGTGGVRPWDPATKPLNSGVTNGVTFTGGAADAGSGGSGSAGQPPTSTHIGGAIGIGAAGSDGGSLQGGGGGANNAGTGGGTVTALPTTNQFLNAHHGFVIAQAVAGRNVVNAQLGTSSSGGGGHGAAGDAVGGGGGGGGASGANGVVCARTITGVGSIEARGGNGGASGGTKGGGGGGGGGGIATVVTSGAFPTVSVVGGAGGARGGAVNTTDGGDGGPGRAYLFAIGT